MVQAYGRPGDTALRTWMQRRREHYPGPLHQLRVGDRPTCGLAFSVLLPVCPRLFGCSVVHRSIQVGRYPHCVLSDSWTCVGENGPRDDIHVSPGALNIAPGILLNLVPSTAVLCCAFLGDHVRKAKTLSHSSRRGHVPPQVPCVHGCIPSPCSLPTRPALRWANERRQNIA